MLPTDTRNPKRNVAGGALCCSLLQSVAACCSLLQSVMLCVADGCARTQVKRHSWCRVLQSVAACCSVLQSVLPCVADGCAQLPLIVTCVAAWCIVTYSIEYRACVT